MIKKIFFIPLIVIALFSTSLQASSKIDSIRERLAFAYVDTVRYDLNLELAREFLKSGSDSSLIYAQEALQIAVKNDDVKRIINAKFDIAGIFYRAGNYNRSIEVYYDILKFLEDKVPNDIGIYKVSFNIGLLNEKVANFEKAREYYLKAIEFSKTYVPDERDIKIHSIGRAYNNIGVTYLLQENYPKALEYFDWVIEFYNLTGDSLALKYVYNNYGLYYNAIHEYDSAFMFFKKSLEIRSRENDYHGIALTHIYMAECWEDTEDYKNAQLSFETALSMSKQHGYIDLKQMASEALIDIYNRANEVKKSNEMHEMYKQITDSLNIVESSRIASMLEMQYSFDRFQEEVKLQKQRIKYRSLLTILGLTFISITSILLFVLMRNKLKRIALQNQKIKLERKNLSDELILKNKELTSKLMYLIGKNELINYVSTHLHKNLSNFKKANQEFILDLIKQMNNSSDDEMWNEFEIRFRDVNDEFYQILLRHFPNLSTNEKKLCAFLKLNMSTKDISAITHQTPHTINIARSRLRKKLGIDNKEISLNDFLMQLDTTSN